MGLESTTYIDGLNSSWPLSSDLRSQGDDHIRLIKAALLATFPSITGAITATQAEINIVDGLTVTTAELNLLDGLTANYTELNLLDGLTAVAAPNVVQNWSRQQYNGTATLTDGATISWNLDQEPVAVVTLAGNRTLNNPTNMKNGGHYTLTVKQDGTGGRTLAYSSAFKWQGGVAPVLSTAANAIDIITCISDGTSMFCSIGYAFA